MLTHTITGSLCPLINAAANQTAETIPSIKSAFDYPELINQGNTLTVAVGF